MLYALERESDLGSTFTVSVELSEGGDVRSGPVPSIWNFPPNGLPLDQSLRGNRARRTRRSESPPSHLFPCDVGANGERHTRASCQGHPSWGARKLKARLEMLQPDVVWPAASTFGNILSRAGLTSPQKKRKRTTPCSEPFSMVTGPNQLWCMDFKGYFATGDGKRCDPFTITDAYSRYLIRCQIVSRMDLSQVRAICEAAMREYGMPARIRTDNGAPFAGTGLLGLSKLSLGWMKLGIVHERIQAGRPQQNGRHERMHRTLKEDTTKPPAASLRAQQSRFDNFRYVFNNERPHEGLNNQVPASLYIPSSIRLPRKLPEFTYPKGLLLRRVNNSGDISWHKNRVFISEVFRFEELAFELTTPGFYKVFFRDMDIGELNVEELRFRVARRVV